MIFKKVFSYKQSGCIKEQELLDTIKIYIKNDAYVYAVMDNAVALGRYTDGMIKIGLALHKNIISLPLPYLQELRVFNVQKEFRAVRGDREDTNFNFIWRMREDQEISPPERWKWNIYRVMDETYKLWGSVRESNDDNKKGSWSLLSSRRGNEILFPGRVNFRGEKGLKVRNYIQLNQADNKNNLLYFADERLCGFCDWPDRQAEVKTR